LRGQSIHLVQVPPGTPTGFPVAETLGEEVTELDAPSANGLTRHGDAPFQQEFFDIPIAQAEAVIEPDGIADDCEGEPVPRKLLTTQHHVTLLQQLATAHQQSYGDKR
jgi:hypothetical protein